MEGLVVVVWSSIGSPQLGGYGGAGGSSLVLQGVPSARGVWRGWWK